MALQHLLLQVAEGADLLVLLDLSVRESLPSIQKYLRQKGLQEPAEIAKYLDKLFFMLCFFIFTLDLQVDNHI